MCPELADAPEREGAIRFFIKFFRNEEHLDALINGVVYLNTPEYYRLSNNPGVSDAHESVVHAYRSERGDRPAMLKIDDRTIHGVTAATIRMSGEPDSWMQSWSLLEMPRNPDEQKHLANDVERMREEFGPHYAVIAPNMFEEYRLRIASASGESVRSGAVEYTNDITRFSPTCKDAKFSYQREARILLGECEEKSTGAYQIEVEGGLADIILKNPRIEWTHRAEPKARLTWDGPDVFESELA